MDELRIEDADGDGFTLSEAPDSAAWLETLESSVVRLLHMDAVRMVAWLQEHFGLTRPIGMDPGLEVNVETETGKTRSVRWYGPDVPGELIKLAEVALRVYDRGADLSGRPASSDPGSLAILRQLMGTLGCERISELPVRVQGLVRELDILAGQIASMAGVTIGPNGVDLPALLDKIKEKHREAITNLEKSHQQLARKERTAYEALELAEDTRRELAGKLEKAREVLADMRVELSHDDDLDVADHGPSGHVQYENGVVATWHRRISEALKASDPDA
jgi:hypothetical protein